MSLDTKDLESIERVIYRNGDDLAVHFGRSFERIEEKIASAELRTFAKLAELEDRLEAQAIAELDTAENRS